MVKFMLELKTYHRSLNKLKPQVYDMIQLALEISTKMALTSVVSLTLKLYIYFFF